MGHDSPISDIKERLRKSGIDVDLGIDGTLSEGEIFWRDHQPWLKEQGYALRKRYQPDWVPSWKKHPGKSRAFFEDGVHARHVTVLDATREDGTLVVFKQIRSSDLQGELTIGNLVSSEPFVSHPDNHCVPVLEVLQVPDDPNLSLAIMPYLHDFHTPKFETVGEVVELLCQIFRGLKLMHDNYIAHRDIKLDNIMANTLHLFNVLPHPARHLESRDFRGKPRVISSRTRRPVRYYIIDYGLSKAYHPEDAPFREVSGWGGDRTVPEFQTQEAVLCDPFPVDVYCMGNVIRGYFLGGDEQELPKKGIEFMRSLVQDMVKDDPNQRPTMAEVVSRFEEISNNLSSWKLRSRVVDVSEWRIPGWYRSARHWVKQASYVVRRIPAIPKP